MDWKEKLVLPFRTITINKNIISKAMQNFVDEFNNNLDKYNISDMVANTDLNEYIVIKGYKKIEIKYNDENVTFALYDNQGNVQDVFIRLRIIREVGGYLVDYINTNKIAPQLEYFINENIIDNIFEKLFELNQEVVQIKR